MAEKKRRLKKMSAEAEESIAEKTSALKAKQRSAEHLIQTSQAALQAAQAKARKLAGGLKKFKERASKTIKAKRTKLLQEAEHSAAQDIAARQNAWEKKKHAVEQD